MGSTADILRVWLANKDRDLRERERDEFGKDRKAGGSGSLDVQCSVARTRQAFHRQRSQYLQSPFLFPFPFYRRRYEETPLQSPHPH
jgi:hypothetical protein